MSRRSTLAVALSLAGCLPLLAAGPAVEQDPHAGDLRATLERRIPELLHAGDVPGVSIAVLRDGRLAWSGALGVADPASGALARPDTVFQAASLSKPVFAYLVLRLVDRGVLGLDVPLVTYLPYERFADERAARITARMVLSHTTGLPNWGGEKLKLAFAPGERFSYSGEGFFYLQKVVEKITGAPLAELARRDVFVPLGMTRSSYVWPGDPGAAGVDEAGAVQPTDRGQAANAAASLLTTAGDYGRFLLAVVAGQGLKPETAALMLTPQIHVPSKRGDTFSAPRDDIAWGLGWGLTKAGDGGEVFWHWGHQDAWRAFAAVRRDGRAGLVCFANSATGLSIGRALADLAGMGGLPVFDWLEYESYDNPRWTSRRELVRAFTDHGAAAGLRRFAERRAAAPGVVDAKLAGEAGDLLIESGKAAEGAALWQQSVEIAPSAAGWGSLGDAELAAGDLESALHAYETAARLDPSAPHTAEIGWAREGLEARKQPATLSAEALRRFAGDYGPRHLRLEGDRLAYHRDGRPVRLLIPMSADTFFVTGDGSVRVRFASSPDGRVTKVIILGPGGPEDESPRDP